MKAQLPILVILLPLFTAFIVSGLGLLRCRFCHRIALVGLAGTFICTLFLLNEVLTKEIIEYAMGGWQAPIGIVFVVDRLNSLVLIVISIVALLTAIHSVPIVDKTFKGDTPVFYALYLLMVAGLNGMTITGDAFNLYVMIEIVALSNYALIATVRDRACVASFNYLIVGTIGACFYLLGLGFLYIKTGTLNMADLKSLLPPLYESRTVLVAFSLIVTGLFMKMALFPFHGWLPNAYTHAPNPVSCLIAPLTTKVSLYVLIRVMFWVFGSTFILEMIDWNEVVVGLATISIIAGGLLALSQTGVKRMLTYIIIAEVGYVVGGAWLVNQNGFVGSVFHIASDALVTLCVFMVVAAVAFKTGEITTLKNFRGMFQRMPLTMAVFVVGAFTLIGVPPTSGFFSKWYLISGAIDAGQWYFVFALIFASIINVIIFFRIFEIAHFEPEGSDSEGELVFERNEAPLIMLVPMGLVSLGLIVLGLGSQVVIQTLILPIVPF